MTCLHENRIIHDDYQQRHIELQKLGYEVVASPFFDTAFHEKDIWLFVGTGQCIDCHKLLYLCVRVPDLMQLLVEKLNQKDKKEQQ